MYIPRTIVLFIDGHWMKGHFISADFKLLV